MQWPQVKNTDVLKDLLAHAGWLTKQALDTNLYNLSILLGYLNNEIIEPRNATITK